MESKQITCEGGLPDFLLIQEPESQLDKTEYTLHCR
jgi:hypothetical protein